MGSLQTGGGTSAVAASAHAGCRRFRLTDAFLTGKTRKSLASFIGAPDTTAGIPEARWTRAMTFERLVHDERYVSELLTKTLGQLDLERPDSVARVNCKGAVDSTAKALTDADLKANFSGVATILSSLAVPYLHLEDENATTVLPDFAIVAPRIEGSSVVGSWLIMGDAKDYERIRSRIDDGRMLKGFLQVALGAESAAEWSKLPKSMEVHPSGALAVPRNSFLQPEAVVEELGDHRAEVRGRAIERLEEKRRLGENRPTEAELSDYVGGLEAEFDPSSCVSCNLFTHCRGELRESDNLEDVLIEIGVEPRLRPAAAELVDGSGDAAAAPAGVRDQVIATLEGRPVWRNRRRTDPVATQGAIYVALAKADSSAVGIHGISLRRAGGAWQRRIYSDAQSVLTRRSAMEILGEAIMSAHGEQALPLHIVVPDGRSADLLVSVADSVAGTELSRMRWQRDLDAGREALTFDGTPAKLPPPLSDAERVGVAFLLEQDRSRAMLTRTPIIDLRVVLASHVCAGGPSVDSLRLDYLLEWAAAEDPIEHRKLSDQVSEELHTPGARLSNRESDAIWKASREDDADPYRELVANALAYKQGVIDRVEAVLDEVSTSRLRDAFSLIEFESQDLWWRRVALGASDLVRFSRTQEFWRNRQVPVLDDDKRCFAQLLALVDHAYARDRAMDAGAGELAAAEVVALDPVRFDLDSLWFGDGVKAVALHRNGGPIVEQDGTTLRVQKGSFKFGQLSIGTLREDDGEGLIWEPNLGLDLELGDEVILADGSWFTRASGHEINVVRPAMDADTAPKSDCTPSSYADDPEGHQWCCKPHVVAEAETADYFASKREAGEMNPETWPPLVDEERFDVGDATEVVATPEAAAIPSDLTLDDLD